MNEADNEESSSEYEEEERHESHSRVGGSQDMPSHYAMLHHPQYPYPGFYQPPPGFMPYAPYPHHGAVDMSLSVYPPYQNSMYYPSPENYYDYQQQAFQDKGSHSGKNSGEKPSSGRRSKPHYSKDYMSKIKFNDPSKMKAGKPKSVNSKETLPYSLSSSKKGPALKFHEETHLNKTKKIKFWDKTQMKEPKEQTPDSTADNTVTGFEKDLEAQEEPKLESREKQMKKPSHSLELKEYGVPQSYDIDESNTPYFVYAPPPLPTKPPGGPQTFSSSVVQKQPLVKSDPASSDSKSETDMMNSRSETPGFGSSPPSVLPLNSYIIETTKLCEFSHSQVPPPTVSIHGELYVVKSLYDHAKLTKLF